MQKTLMFLDRLLYFPENVPTLGTVPKHPFPAAWSSSVCKPSPNFKRFIQRVPELAPHPCMADTESLKKLILKKKCPGFKGLRVRDY
jgi:hypothetical protein